MKRRHILVLSLAAVVTAVLVSPAAAGPGETNNGPRRGADAVAALGDRLAAVAAAHGTDGTTLRQRLEADSSLWVDARGGLFYIDPAGPEHTEDTTTETVPVSAAGSVDVFTLHSRAGAARTVYLDFDGVGGPYGGVIGAAWSDDYTGGDGVAEPYTLDADLTSFNVQERADMLSIWQHVAEDFAPFDIDVTTQDPGQDAITRFEEADGEYGTRVAITSTETSCNCGGVAYLGVFDEWAKDGQPHSYYQPAFVYTTGGKYTADAATHEAGHNLGLSHDGSKRTNYYQGHGDWAPIMGVGYYEPITQWSKGEYAGANNKEDDFEVVGQNGGPRRLDDHADGTAGELTLGTPTSGTLEEAGDVDSYVFEVTDATAAVTVDVQPAFVGPNLDLDATLFATSGEASAIAGAELPLSSGLTRDVAAGLGDRFTVTGLEPGTYRLAVSGVGAHDPATTGYSTYGSVGIYSATVTAGPTSAMAAPEAPAFSAVVNGTAVAVSWTDVTNEAGYDVVRETYKRGAWTETSRTPMSANRTTLVQSPGAGTHRYTVIAANHAGRASSVPQVVTIAKTTGGSSK